jgi:hypothetical protein
MYFVAFYYFLLSLAFMYLLIVVFTNIHLFTHCCFTLCNMCTNKTTRFVNAGNMPVGGATKKMRRAVSKKVKSMVDLARTGPLKNAGSTSKKGSTSRRRVSPPPPPPGRRGRRRAGGEDEEETTRGTRRGARVEDEHEATPHPPTPPARGEESEEESDGEESSEEESGEEEIGGEESDGEDEGLGAGWFVLDRTLQWDPPEKYVETDKTLSAPRAVGPYQRGVSTLPKLPYDESDCVLLPAGDK